MSRPALPPSRFRVILYFRRSRTPWSFHLGFLLGSSLQDKTLGVVGLGQIGQAVARRALGFGMRIVYSGRSRAAEDVEKALSAKHVPFTELLASSDVVSLHCPLTPQTRHLIDAEAMKAMKPGAYLINVASYQHGVGYGQPWVHLDGFSEQVIRWVQAYEADEASRAQ